MKNEDIEETGYELIRNIQKLKRENAALKRIVKRIATDESPGAWSAYDEDKNIVAKESSLEGLFEALGDKEAADVIRGVKQE